MGYLEDDKELIYFSCDKMKAQNSESSFYLIIVYFSKTPFKLSDKLAISRYYYRYVGRAEISNKNQEFQQMDFSKIESLSAKLESSINATSDTTERMKSIIEEAYKPIIQERRIAIDIVSKKRQFLFSSE